MAYEEKKYIEEESDDGLELLLRFARSLVAKWWVIVLTAVIFALAGFAVAKVTYKEVYSSTIIFNVNNKDKDIAGSAATYITSSDADASATIANNFKHLVQNSNDFISLVQANVKATTGADFSKESLHGMISVEQVTDSTLLNIQVKSGDAELAYAVANAIQSVYPGYVEKAFPTATFVVADSATKATLVADNSTLMYIALGFVVGAALACAFILINARIENRVLSSEDMKKHFNIKIIASIAKINKKTGKNEKLRLLITDKNVGLPFIETFKLIRTKLENVKLKKGFSVFSVTSSTESEGKTTCSTNIALSLAKSGKSVLLIDADLRKPAVSKLLGLSLENEKGVYDVVCGAKSFEEAVKYVEKYNLYLLVASEPVADPSEILASAAMENIIKEAKKNFDYVIVDCPPAGLVADAAIVANYVDSIVFVTTEGRVSVGQVEYALSDLYTTKAELLGCIYNGADTKPMLAVAKKGYGGYGRYGGYGHYGSSYYYGSSSGSDSGKHHRSKTK